MTKAFPGSYSSGQMMIIDKIESWKFYPYGPAWAVAFEFLSALTPDMADQEYLLQGDKIFARVMSYPTKAAEAAVLESHRRYVDIQTTIIGAEGIEWFPRESLPVEKPYDQTADVEFYRRPSPGPARVDVYPGTFVMLFPHDAHMPASQVGGASEVIKKAVVKIEVGQLLSQ